MNTIRKSLTETLQQVIILACYEARTQALLALGDIHKSLSIFSIENDKRKPLQNTRNYWN
jgi:hypothetical protein